MEKSDTGIVAKKAANKGRSRPAELLEPSPVPEGKLENSNTVRARDRVAVQQGADRLRQFVKRKPKEQLTTLLHHITVKSLSNSEFGVFGEETPSGHILGGTTRGYDKCTLRTDSELLQTPLA